MMFLAMASGDIWGCVIFSSKYKCLIMLKRAVLASDLGHWLWLARMIRAMRVSDKKKLFVGVCSADFIMSCIVTGVLLLEIICLHIR